jgi:hypothetical protein
MLAARAQCLLAQKARAVEIAFVPTFLPIPTFSVHRAALGIATASGGVGVRGMIWSMAGLAALFMAGCAKSTPSLTRIEGSEPQRLAFGPPKTVQQGFLAKVQQCWLNAQSGILAGYRYDVTPAITQTATGPLPLEQITVYGGKGDLAFTVEFTAFNENTLIATRNRGFPPPLAGQLKRDIERWTPEAPGCEEAAPAEGSAAPQGFTGAGARRTSG